MEYSEKFTNIHMVQWQEHRLSSFENLNLPLTKALLSELQFPLCKLGVITLTLREVLRHRFSKCGLRSASLKTWEMEFWGHFRLSESETLWMGQPSVFTNILGHFITHYSYKWPWLWLNRYYLDSGLSLKWK